jgi:glycosyltransferase involved in cell wall biosynthesis
MYRILYISPGPPPPNKNPLKNKFYHLSRYFSGDILEPMWGVKNDKSRKAISDARSASGSFYYHVTFSSRLPRIIKPFWNIFFYLSQGTYLHYFKKKIDVIVAYGPFTTGLAGYLLKNIIKAKLIVEIPGNPKKSFSMDSETPDTINKLKNTVSDFLVQQVISGADHIKLLYPLQLEGYKKVGKNRVSLFHDFVPVATIRASEKTEKFILFLGYPWFLKGVDVLIKAFKVVSHEFPEYRLKIVGFCPERTFFEKLAEGNDRIELSNGSHVPMRIVRTAFEDGSHGKGFVGSNGFEETYRGFSCGWNPRIYKTWLQRPSF